jgi:hypothetical protein
MYNAGVSTRIVLSALACAAMAALALAQSRPRTNLDYWLQQASTAPAADGRTASTTQAGSARQAASQAAASQAADSGPADWELLAPGVVELSDGSLYAGGIRTTTGRCLEVYQESTRLWRLVPLEALLSASAVVEQEELELQWRWKAMGVPEKTYTGHSTPTRRMSWRLRLIDGTEIVGAIKGQPIWVIRDERQVGPFVLHERDKGQLDQKLSDLVYIRRIIISRRAMEEQLRPSE